MVDFSSTDSSKAPKHTTHEAAQGVRIDPGPFIGIVKNNVDPMRAGRLQIWISELGGDPNDSSAWRTVQYASPFFGVTPPPATVASSSNPTGEDRRTSGQSFENNPHSYGFWMCPPDLGVKVICTFINGDPFKGYWFACIPDWPNMHMVPAIAAGAAPDTPGAPLVPVVEHNEQKEDIGRIAEFYNRQKTPHNKIRDQYIAQGLDKDKDRGPVTSSAFRESPSQVFGFSTPGRALSQPNYGPDGDGEINPNVIGRQGGHSFVMDDGDSDGNSQMVRLRTAGGHQIMMHDNTGFIYLITASGKSWIEMDAGGNINFYADGQFNAKSRGPMNFESMAGVKIKGTSVDISASGAAKISGKGSLDLNSAGMTKVNGGKGLHLKGMNTYLTGDKCLQLNGGSHMDASAGCITLNGKQATKAQAAGDAAPPTGMPTLEPWNGHKRGGKEGSGLAVVYPGSVSTGGVAGSYGTSSGYGGVTGGRGGVTGGRGGAGGTSTPFTGSPVTVTNTDPAALRVAAFTATLEAGGVQNQADVYQSILNRSASGNYGGSIWNNVTGRNEYSPISAAIYGTTSGGAGKYSGLGVSPSELYTMAQKPNGIELMQARFGAGNAANAQRIIDDFNKGGPLSQESRAHVGSRTEFVGSTQPGYFADATRPGDPGANKFGYRWNNNATNTKQGSTQGTNIATSPSGLDTRGPGQVDYGLSDAEYRAENNQGFVDPAVESARREAERNAAGNIGNNTVTPGFTDTSDAYGKSLQNSISTWDKVAVNDKARIDQFKAERALIEEQRGYLTEAEYANAIKIADQNIARAEITLASTERDKVEAVTRYRDFVSEREDTLEGQRYAENTRLAEEKAAADANNDLSNNQELIDDPDKAGPGAEYNNQLDTLNNDIATNNAQIELNNSVIERAGELRAEGVIASDEAYATIVSQSLTSNQTLEARNRELIDDRDAVQSNIDSTIVGTDFNNQQEGNYDPESGLTYYNETSYDRDIDYNQPTTNQFGETDLSYTGSFAADTGSSTALGSGGFTGEGGEELNVVPDGEQVGSFAPTDFGKSDAEYRAESDYGFDRAIDPTSNYTDEQVYGPGGEIVAPSTATTPVTGGSTAPGTGGKGTPGAPANTKPAAPTKPAC